MAAHPLPRANGPECPRRDITSVREVFSHAKRSYLYPLSPLFQSHDMTPRFLVSLVCIWCSPLCPAAPILPVLPACPYLCTSFTSPPRR